ILRGPYQWLEELASSAGAEGNRRLVDVGLELRGHRLNRRARVDVGEAIIVDRIVSLPLRIQAADQDWFVPALAGGLAAAWLGPGRTHLALPAQYEPPFGILGRAADRALLHRVAEAVAQRLLEAVAQRLAPDGQGPR